MKLIQKKPETVREGGIVILKEACFWVALLWLSVKALAGWLLCWDGIHLSTLLNSSISM